MRAQVGLWLYTAGSGFTQRAWAFCGPGCLFSKIELLLNKPKIQARGLCPNPWPLGLLVYLVKARARSGPKFDDKIALNGNRTTIYIYSPLHNCFKLRPKLIRKIGSRSLTRSSTRAGRTRTAAPSRELSSFRTDTPTTAWCT
jgi:hypothetical protein